MKIIDLIQFGRAGRQRNFGCDNEVIDAVLAAFQGGRRRGEGQFVGASGRGFAIEGWYQNGRINSVYPLRGP